MPGLKSWRLDFDTVQADRKTSHDPPGYDANIAKEGVIVSGNSSQKRKDPQILGRKQQALYARATAPLKQIGLMCFMAWMSGNSIQIFSIMMTFSLLASPIASVLTSATMFPREPDWPQLDVLLPRILYCIIQSGQLIFGLYKLNGMGLLPVYASDWVSSLKVPETLELSHAPIT